MGLEDSVKNAMKENGVHTYVPRPHSEQNMQLPKPNHEQPHIKPATSGIHPQIANQLKRQHKYNSK